MPATSVLLLVGLLVAPLAAATFGENHTIDRALPLAPFMALAAAFGVDAVATMGRPWWRAVGIVLFLLIPVQFAVFGVDYLTRYRVETMAWPRPSDLGLATWDLGLWAAQSPEPQAPSPSP